MSTGAPHYTGLPLTSGSGNPVRRPPSFLGSTVPKQAQPPLAESIPHSANSKIAVGKALGQESLLNCLDKSAPKSHQFNQAGAGTFQVFTIPAFLTRSTSASKVCSMPEKQKQLSELSTCAQASF